MDRRVILPRENDDAPEGGIEDAAELSEGIPGLVREFGSCGEAEPECAAAVGVDAVESDAAELADEAPDCVCGAGDCDAARLGPPRMEDESLNALLLAEVTLAVDTAETEEQLMPQSSGIFRASTIRSALGVVEFRLARLLVDADRALDNVTPIAAPTAPIMTSAAPTSAIIRSVGMRLLVAFLRYSVSEIRVSTSLASLSADSAP